MKTILNLLFLFTVFFQAGCVQSPGTSRRSTISSSATSTNGGKTAAPTGAYPTFSGDENLYWFTSTKVIGTVTLNKNSQDVIYLRGKLVHDFLNAKDLSGSEYFRKQYCMVGNFSTTSYKQVRVRAIPIYITTSTKVVERLLRIDIPSGSDNTSTCKYSTIDTTLPAAAAFSLPEICLSCGNQVTTTNINLFEAKTSSLVKIESSLLNLSSVLLKIDLKSNSTDPSSSCTNSYCSAKGFDCCVSGQCVNDASEKASASSEAQYAQAKIDKSINPLSFINYPNIFYICSNISHVPPGTTTPVTTTPGSDAQSRVAKYLTDYTCLTDVSAGNGYSNCRNLDVSNVATAIDKTEAAYTAIKKKLAIACGCSATGDQMAIKCPDWGILPVYPANALKTNANITDFTCYTPLPPNSIGPITNLFVNVPNRSAPHRFFSNAGVNFDDLSGFKTNFPDIVQEGDDFYYLDDYSKAGPVNGSYNINSVIGKMTVDLSHAIPAKVVTVELGKSYILSATSGYFTPCSQCVKDNWFQTFSAHPTSTRGMGLKASGYTTARDSYSGNTTLGNYEDTKFGRACYVPVTMLPLAHQKNASLQTQRQNRLKTQAAMYINGYQRDWYGFNKGALIGSFDGVTWFAVGTGRRTTATSTKLFLALNASFLDLADKTDTLVNIIPDYSTTTAADYDYDPDIAFTDPHQNTAGTCQKFHQCNADADCVSQLGWEYTCADVSQYKTKWPVYNTDATETANQERSGTLFEILQSTISTSSVKRCVYRGAGAPCKRDYSTLNDNIKKNLICAPNFYCASLTTNKFNDELARSPAELDDILFGMDANILGRPLKYATASKSLPTEVVNNISYNSQSFNTSSNSQIDTSDMGICRPGRGLTSSVVNNHTTPDISKRTDYISQIGTCDSNSIGTNRFMTCPAFDSSLNLIDSSSTGVAASGLTASNILKAQTSQNSCGGESKHTNTFISAFKNVEGLSLLNLQNITQPTLVQDACLRRAGSVCNSDLDCGPNKMHEDSAGLLDIKYFGGTDGEQQYWRESLICGQGTPQPTTGSSNYYNYKLSDNRCCREIGKDFTMVTQGPKSIIPENTGTNEKIITSRFTYNDPKASYRYSRYTISNTALGTPSTIPVVATNTEPAANQWKVINETGSLTCCGGGWIRKFANGTHNWKMPNRLNLDSANFSCLNFRSSLADSSYNNFTSDKINATSYQKEYESFCKSPALSGNDSGCLQVPYQNASRDTILSPVLYDPADHVITDESDGTLSTPALTTGFTRVNTSLTPSPSGAYQQVHFNTDAPYLPFPFVYQNNNTLYTNPDTKQSFTPNFFVNKAFYYGAVMYLPAYVGWDGQIDNPTFMKNVSIKYFYDPPMVPTVVPLTVAPQGKCDEALNLVNGNPIDKLPSNNSWCITKSAVSQNRPVIIARADSVGNGNWIHAGLIFDFKPIEQKTYEANSIYKVTEPGSVLYYLSKLSRLELLGIPQIGFEPLYCNNNQEKLVPGIFKSTLSTRTQFNNSLINVNSYVASVNSALTSSDNPANTTEAPGIGNYEKRFSFQDTVDQPAIFSAKDFTCCTPLGKETSSADRCCSGYAVANSDRTKSICKLPRGTDLNVYFNKFVSNEGSGEGELVITRPVGDLDDSNVDFNPNTGEPKNRVSTDNKLATLGGIHCETKQIGTGGAFGAFPPEPFSGSYSRPGNLEDWFPISIVDSLTDVQNSDPLHGKAPFDNGYKWNHHIYCK